MASIKNVKRNNYRTENEKKEQKRGGVEKERDEWCKN